MKSTLGFVLLAGTVMIMAAMFAYQSLFPREEIPYDDDQEGLKDQIVFKFSHVVAENTPKGLAAQKFAELVSEKSDGHIKIEVFPNGSLYSDIEEINALKDGQVHFIAPSTSKLGMLSPQWGVLDLPFAFPAREAALEGLNGDIGRQLLQSLQSDGIKGLAHWPNGFKQITSNKGPIQSPGDMEGQSFRIMQSDVIEAQFSRLNADAIQDSFNSTYQLLEEGKVDGEENTISNIYSKKFYNLQKHLTISNHGYLGYAVMMSEKVWDEQTEETKEILLESMQETTAWNNRQAFAMNEEQLTTIKQNSSIQIHKLTDQQKREWKTALDPVYEEFSKEIGSQLIDEIKELRAKYE
ncbi:TRAP transporter substrate-binding protein [Bacillus sp. ISL-47]|uniref:TRAP transporter substrate-binding protein n=1 Tax=Bacillus sp. ISL-47 TaxID=2819130 RepID=UPI001BEAD1DE|nr:TRAP transporter substrate-binding protein [Bacillus sp. ISL-47]MBT2690202.1 TRAP transporter substrate-binding protein [Bacillus sp. ISL-47]MBT2710349.1 TRAP transporter substrate-binding protein [Pseudomonas sp. ISL-84]